MADDEQARKERARRLREKIDELTSDRDGGSAQRPGESDAEYVHRRMREIDQNAKKPS